MLVHELLHASASQSHLQPFKDAALAVGLEPPYASHMKATLTLQAMLACITKRLGPLPPPESGDKEN